MSSEKIDSKKFPTVSLLDATLRTNHRFLSGSINRCITLFGETWMTEVEQIISRLFPTSKTLVEAVNGYAAFALQSMRLQAEFERELKYKEKTHKQTSSEVYFNEQHMMREYLPGLLLSHFLWPHHYRQLRFFDYAFVQAMSAAGASSFIEVGTGTGLYSSLLLRKLPEVKGTGFDISPFSKKFAEEQMVALNIANRYHIELLDIASTPVDSGSSWLVCVEVLEHLDEPLPFLQALRRNTKLGSRAFITAALNAAHSDHIYLYRNINEVSAQLVKAGFTLEQAFFSAAYKPSSPGVPVPEVAAFIVY